MTTLPERLREETRPQHEQTEALLYAHALRTGTLSVDQYNHLLLTHGAYHQALEQAIDQHSVFFQAYEPAIRRKTPWLMADLAQQNLSLPSALPHLFANWSSIALLGATYVGEGSMLGGKTVWHYLQQSPALQPMLQNARFYRGYGPETGQRWRTFVAFLLEQGAAQPDAVVEAAKRAFLTYHQLFGQTQSSTLAATQAAS